MNQEQLQAIRERCDKATGGTWIARSNASTRSLYEDHWIESDIHDIHGPIADSVKSTNAEFIAHAREDVPALLDEIERLGDALDKQISLSEELVKQRDEWAYKWIARPVERDAEIERLRGALKLLKRHVDDPTYTIRMLEQEIESALTGEST